MGPHSEMSQYRQRLERDLDWCFFAEVEFQLRFRVISFAPHVWGGVKKSDLVGYAI